MNRRQIGLKPIVNKEARILILGSFPSEISLSRQEYYANPRNQFWRITGNVIHEEPFPNEYKLRKNLLKKHNIALWDVIKSCRRVGSKDNKIKSPELNGIKQFLIKHNRIKIIFCNGRKSWELLKKYYELPVPIRYLPSTSPAHAIPYLEKRKKWEIISKYI